MERRILVSVKKNLGLAADYDAFDEDVLTYINSAFSTLNQLGVGPDRGFRISDNQAVWEDFIRDDPRFDSVKSFMYLSVKLEFDPPTTSYAIASAERRLEEYTWRLNVVREGDDWIDPNPTPEDEEL